VDTKTAAGAAQAQMLVADLAPSAPSGLHVVSIGSAAISVAWSASAASDLWYYSVSVDSTSPYDFADSVVVTVASGTSPSLDFGGLPLDTTVYFRVTAVDKGAPSYLGHALESAPSASVSASTVRPLTRPLAPYGITISTAVNSATIGWMPVQAYESGVMFTDPANPNATELTGYHVYRATAPAAAPWSDLVAVSSSALSYTDNAAVPGSYYMVRAYNPAGFSTNSMVRGNNFRNAFIVGFDGKTTFQMADEVATISVNGEGQQSNAYLVVTSSHPEQLSETVVKSLEFTAMRQGITPTPNAKLSNPGMLLLHYDLDPGTGQVVPSGLRGFGASSYRPSAGGGTPDQLSVFWNNGNKWVQLYGKLDAVNQVVAVQTPYLGQYQLRAAERTQSFTFNSANVSNRMVTPNGDGKNDDVLFTFSNPAASEVIGKVFDARGREIATMVPGPVADSLLWDGKSNGKWVPGGVYIYEIKAEGQTHTGTVIVIK
jgi:gliding motility-associated-like protein